MGRHRSLTDSLIHSLTHSLTHPLTHSLTHSLTLTHSHSLSLSLILTDSHRLSLSLSLSHSHSPHLTHLTSPHLTSPHRNSNSNSKSNRNGPLGGHNGKRTAAGSRRLQPQWASGGHPGKRTAAGSWRLSPDGFYLPDRNPFRQGLIREKRENDDKHAVAIVKTVSNFGCVSQDSEALVSFFKWKTVSGKPCAMRPGTSKRMPAITRRAPESQQSYRPIHPSQQVRQRKAQQFEGGENFDCVVDPTTGWRYFF